MSAIAFTDEELDSPTSLAAILPPADRSRFLASVAAKLAGYPPGARGPGLVHRLGVEAQRGFLRTDQVAVGGRGKYERALHLRENRREAAAWFCIPRSVEYRGDPGGFAQTVQNPRARRRRRRYPGNRHHVPRATDTLLGSEKACVYRRESWRSPRSSRAG